MSEWIRVKEQEPPEETVLIVKRRGLQPQVGYRRKIGQWIKNRPWMFNSVPADGNDLTHWMPLPAPPEALSHE